VLLCNFLSYIIVASCSVYLVGLRDKAYDFIVANVTFAHTTLLTPCHMPKGAIFLSALRMFFQLCGGTQARSIASVRLCFKSVQLDTPCLNDT
jgi:hypothetical protein